MKKYLLMYCGIQPSEISAMDIEDVELFSVFYEEMEKSKQGAVKKNGR